MIDSREYCKNSVFISEDSGYNGENVDVPMARQTETKTKIRG